LILDTTYLLPLARIGIDVDLLATIANRQAKLRLEEIAVSQISLFELQAKAAKLMIPARFTIEAVEAIFTALRVIPFHEPEIIKSSYELKKIIPDYADCVIVATATVLKEDLVTEDSLILNNAETIEKKHNIKVLSFTDIAKR